MKIEMFDKVLLKNGYFAYIVEIFDDGKAFIADIDMPDGLTTEYLLPDTIEKVIPYDTWINESK